MAATPSTRPSDPVAVDRYLKGLKHPLAKVVDALRRIILAAAPEVGEEIKWNAPTFFFTGAMAPSDPKLYKRYLVVFNLFRRDCIRLVFWGGANVKAPSGFLQGDYSDGRRLAMFHSVDEVRSKAKTLRQVVRLQVRALDRSV